MGCGSSNLRGESFNHLDQSDPTPRPIDDVQQTSSTQLQHSKNSSQVGDTLNSDGMRQTQLSAPEAAEPKKRSKFSFSSGYVKPSDDELKRVIGMDNAEIEKLAAKNGGTERMVDNHFRGKSYAVSGGGVGISGGQ